MAMRRRDGVQRRRARRLGDQADRAEMKCPRGGDCRLVDILGRHQHVGARAAIEQELALAVAVRETKASAVCAASVKRSGEMSTPACASVSARKRPKPSSPDHTHEGARHAEAHEARGDIRGGAPGGLLEHLAMPRSWPVRVGTKSISSSPKATTSTMQEPSGGPGCGTPRQRVFRRAASISVARTTLVVADVVLASPVSRASGSSGRRASCRS